MAEDERRDPVDVSEELESLRLEVRRLRARVRELEDERLSLLRSAANRDYERPPHYQ